MNFVFIFLGVWCKYLDFKIKGEKMIIRNKLGSIDDFHRIILLNENNIEMINNMIRMFNCLTEMFINFLTTL